MHCMAVAPMLKSAQTAIYPAASAYTWRSALARAFMPCRFAAPLCNSSIGDAEGSIIAAIIAAHIAHSRKT
jgi:hypothetical protein